jgi:DNA (cytosine-5)-methyltransferase 1
MGCQVAGCCRERNATDSPIARLERSGGTRYRSAISCKQANWEDFPTVAPVCSGDDGLPRELDGITFPKWRNESIKGYGNAIVPQVAFQIFKAIEHYEHTNSD